MLLFCIIMCRHGEMFCYIIIKHEQNRRLFHRYLLLQNNGTVTIGFSQGFLHHIQLLNKCKKFLWFSQMHHI